MKKFKKRLDKTVKVWYNNNGKRGDPNSKYINER